MIKNRAKALVATTVVLFAASAAPAQAQVGFLQQHLSAAQHYAATRSGLASFTSIDIGTGETVHSGSAAWTQIRSASVIKVAIGAAALGRARAAGRSLTYTQSGQLTRMIESSDNDAATALWNANGGGAGVLGYVKAKVPGLAMHVDPGHPSAWGYTYVSSNDLALLGAALVRGRLLVPADTQRLLTLMRNVIPSERWGIPQAFPGLSVAVKNGWYPDSEQKSWRVTCLGIVTPRGRTSPVVIAVTTKYPLGYGQGYGEASCRFIAANLVPGTATPAPAPVPAPAQAALNLTPYYHTQLRQGMSGPAVKALQSALGMPVNQRDGVFGPVTRAAVVAFDRRAGLYPNGIVYMTTWWLADMAQPGRAKPTYQYGSHSTLVKMLQLHLGVPGANGYFGPGTRAAVIRFQQTHHLAADGIVGPMTWNAIGRM